MVSSSGPSHDACPPPEEVVLWHHLRIYVKLVRALVSVQQSRQAMLQITKAAGWR